jgi:hypothetical protein
MSSSGSVKLRYEKCLQVWGNAMESTSPPLNAGQVKNLVRSELDKVGDLDLPPASRTNIMFV